MEREVGVLPLVCSWTYKKPSRKIAVSVNLIFLLICKVNIIGNGRQRTRMSSSRLEMPFP